MDLTLAERALAKRAFPQPQWLPFYQNSILMNDSLLKDTISKYCHLVVGFNMYIL